ncbi:hypothetical protein GGI07_002815 [Coemansia sp. Benny D115]|nr:hypothetical protein GGI07_002815 [Coemansia sp. Benny D115]
MSMPSNVSVLKHNITYFMRIASSASIKLMEKAYVPKDEDGLDVHRLRRMTTTHYPSYSYTTSESSLMDSQQSQDPPVHIVLKFPFKRPENFQPPLIVTNPPISLDEQVWRCLCSLPGSDDRPQDILAELEMDQVTFDWELLADTLQVSMAQVFEAAQVLFEKHMGRPLRLVEDSSTGFQIPNRRSIQIPRQSIEQQSTELENNVATVDGMKSVESLGREEEDDEPGSSPVVALSTVTPPERNEDVDESRQSFGDSQYADRLVDGARNMSLDEDTPDYLRQSLIAEAMASRVHQQPFNQQQQNVPTKVSLSNISSKSSSFSDLSNTSLTESAMQDALLSEAMNGSTAMSMLGSRMFPWSKKR